MNRKDKLILEELQNINILTNTNRLKLQELATNLSTKYKTLSEEIQQINSSQQLAEIKNKGLQILVDEFFEHEEEDVIINQFLEQYDNYAQPLEKMDIINQDVLTHIINIESNLEIVNDNIKIGPKILYKQIESKLKESKLKRDSCISIEPPLPAYVIEELETKFFEATGEELEIYKQSLEQLAIQTENIYMNDPPPKEETTEINTPPLNQQVETQPLVGETSRTNITTDWTQVESDDWNLEWIKEHGITEERECYNFRK